LRKTTQPLKLHNLSFTTCYISYIAFVVPFMSRFILGSGVLVEIIKLLQPRCSLQTENSKNDFLLNCHFTDYGLHPLPPFADRAVRTPCRQHILVDTDSNQGLGLVNLLPLESTFFGSTLLVASGAQLVGFPTCRSSRYAICETNFNAEDER